MSYWRNRRVLITGHEGFLGSYLAKALIEQKAKVIGIDKIKNRPISLLKGLRKYLIGIKGNLADLRLVKKIISKYKPQVIFHLAAEPIVGQAQENPREAFKSNIEGTWNLLEAARNRNFIKSIIVASSDKAYGESSRLPYQEDFPLRPRHPYDASKACADLLSGVYAHTYKLPLAITRCGNVFGPGDFHFSRIVPDAVRCALGNKTLLIRSDGKFIRDYVYVEDVIRGYMLLAQRLPGAKLYGQAFNFSSQKPLSVLKLVNIIYRLLDEKPKYRILNQAKYEIRKQYLSAKKAKRLLGWKPQYSLEQGLSITIGWYSKVLRNK